MVKSTDCFSESKDYCKRADFIKGGDWFRQHEEEVMKQHEFDEVSFQKVTISNGKNKITEIDYKGFKKI